MKYSVALLPTEEGYSVSCPGLPGCWSQGATEEEALANIQDAIRAYLEVAKQLAGPQNLSYFPVGWGSGRECSRTSASPRERSTTPSLAAAF